MKSTILNRAHEITRATLAEFPNADYRATFRIALKIAWEETRACADILREWESMTGEEQYSYLYRMTWKLVRADKAETDKQGNYRPNYFYWIHSADDAQSCADAAWEYVKPLIIRAAEQGKTPSLKAVIATACRNAARKTARAEIKHAQAIGYETLTGEDGETTLREFIKDSQSIAEPIAPSPENALIIRDSIDRACADSIDRAIVDMLIDGKTQRDIAANVGMSQPAVAKRVRAIRARYEDETPVSVRASQLSAEAAYKNRQDAKRQGIA